jgi:hypothetical protein
MATRTIRPRVLTAIYDLGTFTISELCRAAGLADRNQAYAQLDRLKKRGFVEEKTLPPSGSHAPLKQYTLVSDAKPAFAEEMAAYRPKPLEWTESGLAKVALEEAKGGLEKIEQSLSELERTRGNEAEERLTALDTEFETAWTNIATAQLEYAGVASKEKTPSHPVIRIVERWREADAKRQELKTALEKQPVMDWSPMLRTAARAVNQLISANHASLSSGSRMKILIRKISRNLNDENRAQVEMLLDEIRADHKYPFTPVFRHALRSGDATVLFDVVHILKNVDLAWWKYNEANACYLKTSTLRTKIWLAAYEALREQISFRPEIEFKVYSYALESLTRDLYLDVTRGQCVSLVSPREIGFLGASEVVRPTLIIESGSMLKQLDCTFLNPNDSLHAYGPIANDIGCWQGAPDLRVAACLGMWGLPLDNKLLKITKPLKNNRGLLIMQGKVPRLAGDAATILRAEEIAECVPG